MAPGLQLEGKVGASFSWQSWQGTYAICQHGKADSLSYCAYICSRILMQCDLFQEAASGLIQGCKNGSKCLVKVFFLLIFIGLSINYIRVFSMSVSCARCSGKIYTGTALVLCR